MKRERLDEISILLSEWDCWRAISSNEHRIICEELATALRDALDDIDDLKYQLNQALSNGGAVAPVVSLEEYPSKWCMLHGKNCPEED